MATPVKCRKCGRTEESDGVDQLPESWKQTTAGIFCSNCADTEVLDVEEASVILDEEVIYPESNGSVNGTSTLDEGYCEVCRGPCQGH